MDQAGWEAFYRTRDPDLRDQLISEYYPLARRVAIKMHRTVPPTVELDDMISYGTIGLLRAVENYTPHRGVSFESYAISSIRGCILDELRALDWAPRSLRRRVREVESAYSTLENENHAPPTMNEVASRMGVSAFAVQAILSEQQAAVSSSLDEEIYADPPLKEDPTTAWEHRSLCQEFVQIYSSLTSQEQLVIALYYYEGLTLSDIGSVVGIPESRASQIHSKVAIKVRDKLAEALGGIA